MSYKQDFAARTEIQNLSKRKQDELAARHMLSQLVEPGDPNIGRAVLEQGAGAVLRALRQLERGEQPSLALVQLKLPTRWSSELALRLAERELQQAEQLGVRFVYPGTTHWPTQLSDLGARTPLMLRVKGSENMRSLAARGIGIVGARACTRYGQSVTEDLGSRLAANDWTVISGGAYGVDAAAHRGALAVGGSTIAISAAGVDQAVPASNSALFDAISQSGAVVSEAPIGAHPTRSRFLVRNRLIAALSRGVVVTEAALRSGSLSTAREASEIGRILMAVPGPVTSLSSAGGHGLVRDGLASLITSHTEIIELMKVAGGTVGEVAHSRLDDAVIDFLRDRESANPRGGVEIDEVAAGLGVRLVEVLASLCSLESRQLADRSPTGWVLVRKRPGKPQQLKMRCATT